MVYSGAIGDAGWNFVIDQARKKAEQKFGMQIPYVEGAAAPSDAERVMSQFAEQGCNEIFTTTNVYGDIPAKVAAKYPNVIIESEEGIVGGPPNMRIYRVPFWEPNYLLAIHAAVLRSFTSETS
ncbi:MAG: BMP family ABC transporter substrate-binding protein [Chloroflexi bacterium]|nr:BMP family ABC transporter substrate-binding protein [Chloroflexota bacterium]